MKLDKISAIYGAEILLKYVEALEAEVEGVREAKDIEYIHRMRVASRRLRSALPIFSPALGEKRCQRWGRQVRGITSALGAARDADVQIERLQIFLTGLKTTSLQLGIKRLLLRLSQQRKNQQTLVLAELERWESSGTAAEIQTELLPLVAQKEVGASYSPVLYGHAKGLIQQRLEELMSYDGIVNQPEKVTELHAMRIACKHFRYTLELFSPLYSSGLKDAVHAVREAQEALGDVHDCDVWTTYLPQFIEEERGRVLAYTGSLRSFSHFLPGLRAFAEDRCQMRQAVYVQFTGDWEKWKTDDVWNLLLQTVDIPVYRPEKVFPPLAAAEETE